MAFHSFENGIEPRVSNLLNRVPALARYTRNRGVTFVISWAHRLTGVLVVIFIGFHIYTLSSLTTPGAYADKMKLYRLPLLAFIEWTLALPVMVHALNGGRLILYESFRCRKDEVLLNWVVGLTFLYAGLLAVLMLMGSQNVSAVFFWLVAVALALTAAYGLYVRIGHTAHAWSWKLQRLTRRLSAGDDPRSFPFYAPGPAGRQGRRPGGAAHAEPVDQTGRCRSRPFRYLPWRLRTELYSK